MCEASLSPSAVRTTHTDEVLCINYMPNRTEIQCRRHRQKTANLRNELKTRFLRDVQQPVKLSSGFNGSHCSSRACLVGCQHEGAIRVSQQLIIPCHQEGFNGLDTWWFSLVLRVVHFVFTVQCGWNAFIRLGHISTAEPEWMLHIMAFETEGKKERKDPDLSKQGETFYQLVFNKFSEM